MQDDRSAGGAGDSRLGGEADTLRFLREAFEVMKKSRRSYAVMALRADPLGNAAAAGEAGTMDPIIRKHVNQVLPGHVRNGDFIGSHGVDGYLVVLAGMGFYDGTQKAEEVRAAISGGRALTVSIGLAVAEPGRADELAALRRAEACLEDAIAAGGNRVVAVGYSRR